MTKISSTLHIGTQPQKADTANVNESTSPLNLADLSNTSSNASPPDESTTNDPNANTEHIYEDDLLLEEDGNPQRKAQPPDITKNPMANTLAITVVTFIAIGGISGIWWILGKAKAQVATEPEVSEEEIIDDAKQAEIDRLQQQLYEQRANVALKDLESPGEAETLPPTSDTSEQEPLNLDDDDTNTTGQTTPVPPPPQRATPRPVSSSASSSPSSTQSSTPPKPVYDDPGIWAELAQLGMATADVEEASDNASTIPVTTEAVSGGEVTADGTLNVASTIGVEPANPWSMAQLPVVTVSPTALSSDQVSPGEIGILHQQQVVNTSNTATISSTKGRTDEPNLSSSSINELNTGFGPRQQYDTAVVAIGNMTQAEVVTPIMWDQEAPRNVDGIFAVVLTEPMIGIHGEVVLPTGTQLVANVSHVTSMGHVFQTVTAIVWPNGTQIPVPVYQTEDGTDAPISPLVIRGKRGETLIADAIERRRSGNRPINELMVAAMAGIADAADNALEPETTVNTNISSGGSTTETQENTRDPQAAFARGFFEEATERMGDRFDEEPEEVQIFQVSAGEDVSVIVNGVMEFAIPRGGWSNETLN